MKKQLILLVAVLLITGCAGVPSLGDCPAGEGKNRWSVCEPIPAVPDYNQNRKK